ncbi:TetR/AcrR family transcriptional regulator [Cohnella zeiphila]|uniref:TetR/AcrR family transcriptional regulator n=1 Tax=Cohnella zeiphila TaxID=2761120 RepID=A0A7X0SIF5_9BACL|nr:TetR/AcrR family transcriptional regulator [Cohnella zeiphila]MBB6729285.1 TetR/AcrR family transcriptional regulator [Cohnella zeiphila]
MKRELKREQTLRKLIEASRDLIREKGCIQTTMSDIMERSGLSKGAIFHYVKGKDELFGLVLQSRTEETDRLFKEAVNRRPDFQGPMRAIASGFPELSDPQDVSNRIFRYLLGRSEEPGVGEILARYYEDSVRKSAVWIEQGQRHGVIPEAVDANKTGEMFVLLSLGMRLRSGIEGVPNSVTAEDMAEWIAGTLHSQPGTASSWPEEEGGNHR